MNLKILHSVLISYFSFFYSFFAIGQEKAENHYFFKQNKGQWNSKVLFKADIQGGAMFLENTGITYNFLDYFFLKSLHGDKKKQSPYTIHGHSIKSKFKNANPFPAISKSRISPYYENYFLGNDSSKWKSEVRVFNQVYYTNIYSNIDFKIYESNSNMKYDFIVNPGGNHKDIRVEYQGADKIYIEHGILYIKTSLSDIIENKPYAYQLINGKKITVPCKFRLRKKTVSFIFPKGYDKKIPLIIDPYLVFATYSGSTADNFGYTATYDSNGMAYGGGIVFNTGYPTTLGAYDRTYSGSAVDIAISKFSANGSSLLFSTYLGGSKDESPHSLVTNNNGELYILGTTSSSNFPTSTGCYDNTFNGGSSLSTSLSGTGLTYSSGSDIIVVKFNSTGTSLLGSTFVGGTGNDGINLATGLEFNYGDYFRGEIILDNTGNCYVTSTTTSTNFPNVSGTTFRGGTYDAVFFKLNSTLTTLQRSTYFGGNGNDAGYGLQQDASGNTFVTGGTTSTNLSSSLNSAKGGVDGFLAKFSSTNSLISSRYIGTSSYDQSFFVQIDSYDSVYIFGQSSGNMPVTTGKYSNSGSHQFIQKFNNTITTLAFSTVFGSGRSTIDISPSAFLVNNCGLIYMSGWGGAVNTQGSVTGLPTSTGAFQTTTTGSDFYLMVLNKNASSLNYATFFGGGISAEHVDGGTSRFDKQGNVYQAVCAGCGGRNDFPTNSSAWSTTNNSTNCNLGVFKFNISQIKALASVPSVTICYPNAAIFSNNSANGNTFFWEFGDGTTSNIYSPTHIYTSPGTYKAKLTVSDSTGCLLPDSDSLIIIVKDTAAAKLSPDTSICIGSSVNLFAIADTGTTFSWSPASTLNNSTIANPVATPTATTTYRVITTNFCTTDTGYITITTLSLTTNTSQDTTLCNGDTATIFANGGATYNWTPSSTLLNPTSNTPKAFPSSTTKYYVNVQSVDGCSALDSVTINVIYIPTPILTNDNAICINKNITLNASGADSYVWKPSKTLSSSTGSQVVATPKTTTKYFVDFTNRCATLTDSVTITVNIPKALVSADQTVCFNKETTLWASGGVSYSWSPSAYITNPSSDTIYTNPPNPTTYRVVVTDANGCKDTAYSKVNFSPIPTINAGPDQIIIFGETAFLKATSSPGDFYWSPNLNLSNIKNKSTSAKPSITSYYIANLKDSYGCIVSDTVTIYLDGSLYTPNSFTPNGDGLNDFFKVKGKDITKFEIMIFNRWGEKLYESNSLDESWDGTYKGKLVKVDSYIWKIVFSDIKTPSKEVIGHVNVIR